MRRLALAALFLLVFGGIRLPIESMISRTQNAADFHSATVNLEIREQVGQLAFLAALSGFRSLVAALVYIEGHIAWEKTEWGKMIGHFNTTTSLQPRSELYWDMAGWHAAWNAGGAALQDPDEPSEILRERAARQYVDVGRDFLERGISNLPESYLLHERLGILLRDKLEDHCAAAEAFAEAAGFEDAPGYIRRFAAYELSRCPGREREAYELLAALYREGDVQRRPTLLRLLGELEAELEIPPAERLLSPAE